MTGGALLAAIFALPAYAAVGPVAHDDNYSTAANTNINAGNPGVLGNDTDPNGQQLRATLVAGAQHGSVFLNPNGSFNYTPTTNYTGPDQFTYTACEPTPVAPATTVACDTATVFINVNGTTPTTTPVPPPVGGTVSYPTCAAAIRAGAHDIPRSDPRYRTYLDRDRDGIACELNGQDNPPPPAIIVRPTPTTIVKPAPTTIVEPPTTTIQAPATVVPGPVIQGPATVIPGPVFNSPAVPSGPVATGDGTMAGSN